METGENNSLELTTDSFDISLSEQYNITLQIGLHHVTYIIKDDKDLSIKKIEHYNLKNHSKSKNLKNIKLYNKEKNIFKNNFSKVLISYVGFPNTLIPKEIYNKNNEKEILQFNTNIYKKIFADELVLQDTIIVYTIPNEIITLTKVLFPTANYIAQEKILIDLFYNKQENTECVYLSIYSQQVIITIFNGKKLIFNNTFDFKTSEDLLYYVLFSLEQLQLSRENVKVVLLGLIKNNDLNYKLLYEYIRNLTFINRDEKVNIPNELRKLEEHEFFGLI